MTTTYTQTWRRAAAANNLDEYACDPRFPRLCELLLEANEKVNLTAVRDPAGVAVLHFADSLTALPFIPEGARTVDVGCGGGFPSLPLAIARPDITVVALDSTEKKLRFVADAARELGLDNLTTLYARAEEAGRDPLYRETFDCAVARAVAPLDILAEFCLPLVRAGGRFVAMKSRSADAELTLARPVIEKLGGGVPEVRRLTLLSPDAGREYDLSRVILVSGKRGTTPPEYPRHYSQIKKSHDKKVKKESQNP